jgi:subtilase family serine protease
VRGRQLVSAATLITVAMLLAGTAVAGDPTSAPPSGVVDVCAPVPDGYARCFAEEAASGGGAVIGYHPGQITDAYRFPHGNTVGAGQTVAIVSAYDAPTIEQDLGVFDRKFHLRACTSANGCFTKLDSSGGTSYPPVNNFWAFESSIDVEWAHAIAPGANIVLVESTTNVFADMLVGVDLAKTKGRYVSGSWGSPEGSVEPAFDHHFSQTEAPGVSFFFASGDNPTPTQYPAASPNVVAVGGTTLKFTDKGVKETGWSKTGGGCSPYEVASPAQAALSTYAQVNCAGQAATPDVSFVADPATGVAVYDSTPDENNLVGWFKVGGTSVATPIMAARAAATGTVVDESYLYNRKNKLFRDIRVGNNGNPCLPGYDLVTGRGAWLR